MRSKMFIGWLVVGRASLRNHYMRENNTLLLSGERFCKKNNELFCKITEFFILSIFTGIPISTRTNPGKTQS